MIGFRVHHCYFYDTTWKMADLYFDDDYDIGDDDEDFFVDDDIHDSGGGSVGYDKEDFTYLLQPANPKPATEKRAKKSTAKPRADTDVIYRQTRKKAAADSGLKKLLMQACRFGHKTALDKLLQLGVNTGESTEDDVRDLRAVTVINFISLLLTLVCHCPIFCFGDQASLDKFCSDSTLIYLSDSHVGQIN